jgi:benzylsuccinate CoA-transferase BbsE subunit
MQGLQPYTGIRVLDFSHGLGSYAARMFADLGAEVIRAEPPGGALDRRRAESDEAARYAFIFRNLSKASMVVDPESPSGRDALAEQLRAADIVFLERDGMLANELEWVHSRAPRAVIVYVSPYGLFGPKAGWHANDLTLQAAGGIAWMSGRAEDPPLRLPLDQSAMITSVYAAVAATVTLHESEQSGMGHLIDVSAQECIAHSLQNAIQVYDLEQRISHRGGVGTRDASEQIFECRDGQAFFALSLGSGRQAWKALLAWLKECGDPAGEILGDDRWLDLRWRKTPEAREQFRAAIAPFIGQFTKAEVMDHAQKRKIIMSSISRISDVLGDAQLEYRDYFVSLDLDNSGREVVLPGAPYLFSEPVWSVAPPPALGDELAATASASHVAAN